MKPSNTALRLWWKKPRQFNNQEKERRVTFLELFYDLVYVVIVAELSHSLSVDITLDAALGFAFLFLMIWWTWYNVTSYHDLHGNNDVKTRIITFVQMFSGASMAIFAHNAFDEGSVGFALSYAIYMLIMTLLWWRTGVHDSGHRALSYPYSLAFLLATGIIIGSLFVETPLRFYLWGVSLFIIVSLPLVLGLMARKKPAMQKQIEQAAVITPSLIERFGLFTIIVLGEVIVGVVRGVSAYKHLSLHTGITAGLGMLVPIGVWWLYFDFVANNSPKSRMKHQVGWLYMHLPLLISITAIGAALLNVINSAEQTISLNARILLISAVAVAYISIAILLKIIKSPDTHKLLHKHAIRVTLAAACITMGLYFLPVGNLLFLAVLDIIMLAPVFFGFRVWLKYSKEEELY